MEKILQGYISDFQQNYGLKDLRPDELFEYFTAYTILTRMLVNDIDLSESVIGGTHDLAIDSITILVNNHPVSSKEEIDYFIQRLGRIDVKFVFIQSKSSEKFEGNRMSDLGFGVKEFFEKETAVLMNNDVVEKKLLQKYIYEKSINLTCAPICELFYITCGKWVDDQNLVGRIKRCQEELVNTHLFSKVIYTPIDVEVLMRYYREIKNRIDKTIDFAKTTALPKISGVSESYLGVLSCADYLKLICDDEDKLLPSLFYDNIRDFQGDNPVNKEIDDTIKSEQFRDKFALLNNGVTIVAKSINRTGDTFRISDFQIVNGCQTSHILYRNRAHVHSSMFLPVKLIVTDNSEVMNRIIKATNRQTEVKLEAFASLTDFHKKLEEYYNAVPKDSPGKLYYERRSKQYEFTPIPQEMVITLAAQIKSFLAMFLDDPHSVHRYYGELLIAHDKKIFMDDHSSAPYYVSGLGLYSIDKLFRERKIALSYKKYHYYILMLIRMLSGFTNYAPLNSKEIEKQCEKITALLFDEQKLSVIVERAVEIIRQAAAQIDFPVSEATRRRSFTELVIDVLKKNEMRKDEVTGVVDWFDDGKGFGIIKDSSGKDYFVHYSSIQMRGHKKLEKNQRVSLIPLITPKRTDATFVKII